MAENVQHHYHEVPDSSGLNTLMIVLLFAVLLLLGGYLFYSLAWAVPRQDATDRGSDINVEGQITLPDGGQQPTNPAPTGY